VLGIWEQFGCNLLMVYVEECFVDREASNFRDGDQIIVTSKIVVLATTSASPCVCEDERRKAPMAQIFQCLLVVFVYFESFVVEFEAEFSKNPKCVFRCAGNKHQF
jgi:hypothetical protein